MNTKYPFLFDITNEKAVKEFMYLRNYDYNKKMNMSYKGNHASNYFFQVCRFNTKFKTRKYSNLEAWDDPIEREKIIKRSEKFNRKGLAYGSKLRSVFQLYYAPILQFKPLIACHIYKRFKPTNILDFSAGWGDRLVAAMVNNINYIGIDTNTDLKKPYKEMIKFYKPYTTSKVKMIFNKAENIDYTKYNYDFIFTSPPYYDKEKYRHMPQYSSYETWLKKFLSKVVINSYSNLQENGHMCLHLPKKLYDVIKEVMGECDEQILYPKQRKNTGYHNNRRNDYSEYMYVWKK